jgi:aconitate hydratase
MRDAMAEMGGDPSKINPLVPAELVIDHSVQVDAFGTRQAFQINADREFERNEERYAFLRWGQEAFDGFSVVPPDTGIVHQVNLEYLSRVVFERDGAGEGGKDQAYPDTLVGTDSHTTMINGLGILGWGVGGIEAEAAMLGQPMSMLIPQVVASSSRLAARGRDGDRPRPHRHPDAAASAASSASSSSSTARAVPNRRADRATIGNMSPEFGSTCAIFPIDAETLRYLEFSGPHARAHRARRGLRRTQGLWHDERSEEPTYSETLELDLGEVVPSLAGPKRPQDRVSADGVQGVVPDGARGPAPGGRRRRGRGWGARRPGPREDHGRGGLRGLVPGVRRARERRLQRRPGTTGPTPTPARAPGASRSRSARAGSPG